MIPDGLRSELAAHAVRGFDQGRMLPAGVYADPAVLAAEAGAIFADGWVAVAHTKQLTGPGAYVAVDVPAATGAAGPRSVLVVRGDDGRLRAFDNVCVHRGAELAQGCGVSARLTCPYHAWVYRLDGSLVGGPYMQSPPGDGAPEFDPAAHALVGLAVEEWEGFVFVNQHPAPPPLTPALAGLTEVVAPFRMAGYVPVHTQVDHWATNWKLLVENFMDAYHVFKVHRGTFAASGDNTLDTTMYPGTERWAHHRVVHDGGPDLASAHNTVLEGPWRRTIVLAAVFPTFVVQLQPDWLWWLQISPLGTGRVQIRWHVAVAPELLAAEPDPDAYVAGLLDLLNRVNAEDQPVVEGVRRSMDQPQFPRGPLSYLERNVFDFDRYVAARLSGPAALRVNPS